MTTKRTVQFPSVAMPLADENGIINRIWLQFFYALYNEVGSIAAAQAAQTAANAANAAAAAANTAAATAQTSAATANTAATTAQASATTANISATTANTAATAAQTTATTVTAANSLQNSYVTGATLTGTDAGANVTVTVSAHTRMYGNGTSVAVSAGSVTALAYSTLFYIYYDDAARTGGAVTYAATTSSATAAQTGNRHLVGSVLTPAALAAPSTGKYVQPPGVGAIP